jgi:hypothetical protein
LEQVRIVDPNWMSPYLALLLVLLTFGLRSHARQFAY